METDEVVDLIGRLLEWVFRLAFVSMALLILWATLKVIVIEGNYLRKDIPLGILFFLIFYFVPTYYLGRRMIKDLMAWSYSSKFLAFSMFYIIWGMFLLFFIAITGLGPGHIGGIGDG